MSRQPERPLLHFNSMNEVIARVEELASGEVETTGRYSFGQILEHLARAMDVVTGKSPPPPAPWAMRLLGPLVRRKLLSGPMKAGFKLPSQTQSFLWPTEEVDVATGLDHFREAFATFMSKEAFARHPFFGNMTKDQNHQLQCRHCELHLSFVQPVIPS